MLLIGIAVPIAVHEALRRSIASPVVSEACHDRATRGEGRPLPVVITNAGRDPLPRSSRCRPPCAVRFGRVRSDRSRPVSKRARSRSRRSRARRSCRFGGGRLAGVTAASLTRPSEASSSAQRSELVPLPAVGPCAYSTPIWSPMTPAPIAMFAPVPTTGTALPSGVPVLSSSCTSSAAPPVPVDHPTTQRETLS